LLLCKADVVLFKLQWQIQETIHNIPSHAF
jgi:hypothetical protein